MEFNIFKNTVVMKMFDILMMGGGVGLADLYNWFTVNGNSTNLITDLHVPSHTEWETLDTYMGGTNITGGELKEVGLDHWDSPNTGAVDSVNFTALGGGHRIYDTGLFTALNRTGAFWSSTALDADNSFYQTLAYNNESLTGAAGSKNYGFSIRCMRDLTAQEQLDFADGEVVETKSDNDGNDYDVVRIGAQGWTTTNLKTTTYLDTTAMTNVIGNAAWVALTTEGYSAYDENNV